CTRAFYAVKARDGNSNASSLATATLSPSFTVTGTQTITIRFNYRAVESAQGDVACSVIDSGSTDPANKICGGQGVLTGGAKNCDVQITFATRDNAGVPITSTS